MIWRWSIQRPHAELGTCSAALLDTLATGTRHAWEEQYFGPCLSWAEALRFLMFNDTQSGNEYRKGLPEILRVGSRMLNVRHDTVHLSDDGLMDPHICVGSLPPQILQSLHMPLS